MRAGFELYRASEQDSLDNRSALEQNGKLQIPVLGIFGAISNTGLGVEVMMRDVAENVRGLRIRRGGDAGSVAMSYLQAISPARVIHYRLSTSFTSLSCCRGTRYAGDSATSKTGGMTGGLIILKTINSETSQPEPFLLRTGCEIHYL